MSFARIGIISFFSFLAWSFWRDRESLASRARRLHPESAGNKLTDRLVNRGADERHGAPATDAVPHDASHRRRSKLKRAMPPKEVAI